MSKPVARPSVASPSPEAKKNEPRQRTQSLSIEPSNAAICALTDCERPASRLKRSRPKAQ